jgi:hypothetical protein
MRPVTILGEEPARQDERGVTGFLTRYRLADTMGHYQERPLARPAFRLCILSLTLLLLLVFVTPPRSASAEAYFEDGYLGLTQDELRAKLGPPKSVRDRKSALRVFNYYDFSDWENYYKKLMAPQNGEDVYTYTREGVNIRYSFSYVIDPNDTSDNPTLHVSLIDIEFTPSVPIEKIPMLVPEFHPAQVATSPAFRSNIWVLLFKGSPSADARMIVRQPNKDSLDWTLAFQIFSLQGLPDFLTLQTPVDRMEVSAQSVQLVRERQRLTHEPIMNPFSREFALRPPPPPKLKKVPVPQYAE